MRFFEIELPGFNGETDQTDHLILHVKASSAAEALALCPCWTSAMELEPGQCSDSTADAILPRDAEKLNGMIAKLMAD